MKEGTKVMIIGKAVEYGVGAVTVEDPLTGFHTITAHDGRWVLEGVHEDELLEMDGPESIKQHNLAKLMKAGKLL